MADYFAPRYNDFYTKTYINQYFEETYSEFVTGLLVDLARVLIPSSVALANTDLRSKLFAKKSAPKNAYAKAASVASPLLLEEDSNAYFERFFSETGQLVLAPESYPLLHFIHKSDKSPLLENLLRGPNLRISELYPQAALLSELLEGYSEIASPEICKAIFRTWFDYEFSCDKPLPNIIINTILGNYGYPHHVNPLQSLRLQYTAKVTPMYSDCLVLDQCRYFYDYIPTIDLIPARFRSLAYQLVLRANIDCFARHVSQAQAIRSNTAVGPGLAK